MQSVPAPPTAREPGHTGVASVRLRRTSTKSEAVNGDDASSTIRRTTNQEVGEGAARGSDAHRNRQESLPLQELFSFSLPQRQQTDPGALTTALQDNIVALTAFNQREKALSAALRAEVQQLTATLADLNERYELEKSKNASNGVPKQQKSASNVEPGFLPDIHGGSTLAVATAALQQHTQMEVSYQRKVLSLESKCAHHMENNTKLLAKIKRLERTQTEAQTQMQELKQDNARLDMETHTLKSTITSQSALVIGLRTSVQKLTHDGQRAESLTKSLERAQAELIAVRLREKQLLEEHQKIQSAASMDKEALMSKLLSLQQSLQRSEKESGHLTALDAETRKLQRENAVLVAELEASRASCQQVTERVQQQMQSAEQAAQSQQFLEKERAALQDELSATKRELECSIQQCELAESRVLEAEARAVASAQQQELAELLEIKDGEVTTLMRKVVHLETEREQVDHKNAELLDELQSVKTELHKLKQLSQDETVQALQLARQKAATHEALTLLNEEKYALEEQLRVLQTKLEAGQSALQQEAQLKDELLETLDASKATIETLQRENRELLQQVESTVVQQFATEDGATDQPEVADIETASVTDDAEPEAPDEQQEELGRLRGQLETLQRNHSQLELEHKRLATRKYKTESFQAQVRLLQHENAELSARLDEVDAELHKTRQVANAQTREMLELKSRVLAPEAIHLLRKTQESLEHTVTALVEAEQASESSFTCLQCLQLFVEPVTLAPCGHTYCAACLARCGDVEVPSSLRCSMCSESDARETDCVFPNRALAELTAKFVFRQQSLTSLTSMCLSLRTSFAGRGSSPHQPVSMLEQLQEGEDD